MSNLLYDDWEFDMVNYQRFVAYHKVRKLNITFDDDLGPMIDCTIFCDENDIHIEYGISFEKDKELEFISERSKAEHYLDCGLAMFKIKFALLGDFVKKL